MPPPDTEKTFYWQHAQHRGTFTSDQSDTYSSHEHMRRITLQQYLEAHWGVSLDELPADVRAEAEKVMSA